MRIIAMLFLTLAPVSSFAQVAASTGAAPSAFTKSEQIAALYLQEDRIIDKSLPLFEQSFEAGFAKNGPAGAKLEAQFPGIKEKALKAGKSAFITSYRAAIPQWRQHLAAYFASHFSEPEINDLIDFYQSPAGQKTVDALTTGMHTDELQKRALANPEEFKLKTEDADNMVNLGNLSQLSQDEIGALMKFGMSRTGRKFKTESANLQGVLVQDVNTTIQTMQPDLQAAVVAAVSAHIASFRKGK